jgi:hypothetical protein
MRWSLIRTNYLNIEQEFVSQPELNKWKQQVADKTPYVRLQNLNANFKQASIVTHSFPELNVGSNNSNFTELLKRTMKNRSCAI